MGLAVFGVVAGPLLLLDVVLGVTLQLAPFVLMSALNVLVPKAVVLGVLLLVTLPGVLLVDWLVVRRVWSWAQGTHGSPRRRQSPNVSRVAFAIVALIVSALVLLLMIPAVPLGYWTLSREVSRSSGSSAPIASTRSVLSSDEPAWSASGAHLNLSVTLPPRQVATFSLVQSNAAGLTPLPHYSAYVVAADREPFQGNLQWGWIENEEESTRPSTVFDRASAPSAAPLFQVQVHDPVSGRATTAGPLLEPGAFSALKQQQTLRLQAGRNEMVLLAEPHPSPINTEIAAKDSLWVNIVTAARPESTDPTDGRSTALIGAGSIDWETALDE
jgi:hypothetical protein